MQSEQWHQTTIFAPRIRKKLSTFKLSESGPRNKWHQIHLRVRIRVNYELAPVGRPGPACTSLTHLWPWRCRKAEKVLPASPLVGVCSHSRASSGVIAWKESLLPSFRIALATFFKQIRGKTWSSFHPLHLDIWYNPGVESSAVLLTQWLVICILELHVFKKCLYREQWSCSDNLVY